MGTIHTSTYSKCLKKVLHFLLFVHIQTAGNINNHFTPTILRSIHQNNMQVHSIGINNTNMQWKGWNKMYWTTIYNGMNIASEAISKYKIYKNFPGGICPQNPLACSALVLHTHSSINDHSCLWPWCWYTSACRLFGSVWITLYHVPDHVGGDTSVLLVCYD